MTTYTPYTEMDVWKNSKDLAGQILLLCKKFPSDEQSGFGNNMRSVALALPSKVANGLQTQGKEEKIRKCQVALEVAYSLEARLHIASDLGYINKDELKQQDEKLEICKRMLFGFIKYQRKKES